MPPSDEPGPPNLNYAAAPRKFSPAMFFVRMTIGCLLSFICEWLGLLLAAKTGSTILGFLPLGLLTAAAIVLTVMRKTYGYLTGIAMSLALGILIGAALVVLVLITCAHALGT